MKRLIQKTAGSALFILLLIVAVCGCDSNVTSSLEDNSYARVGELHNAALDAVLADLQRLDEPPTGARELFSYVDASMRSFFRGKEIASIDPGMAIGWQIAFGGSSPFTGSFAYQKTGSELEMLPDSVLNKLTKGQKRYLKKIMRLMQSQLKPDAVSKKLDRVRKSARRRLNESELGVVLAAASVADSSWAYWYENLDEWDAAIGVMYPDSIVVQDVSGANLSARITGGRGKRSDHICPTGFKAERVDVYRLSNGDYLLVITCVSTGGGMGGQYGDNDEGGGGGFWHSMGNVGIADVAGGAGGAVWGALGGPPGVAAGAAGGAATTSVAQGVIESAEWLGWEF